jgi:hypothetical protein
MRTRMPRGRVLVGVLDQLGADVCLLDRILAAARYTPDAGHGDALGSGEPGRARSGVPGACAPAG